MTHIIELKNNRKKFLLITHKEISIYQTLYELDFFKEFLKDYYVFVHYGWHDKTVKDIKFVDFCFSTKNITPNFNKEKLLGFDSSDFVPDYFTYKKNKKIYDICFISRLMKQKKILNFLISIKKVILRKPQIRVLLILPDEDAKFNFDRYGHFKKDFEKLFTPKERNNFDIISSDINAPFNINLDLVAELINLSKVFVHTSTLEGSPKTVREALCIGIPSIIPVPSTLGVFHKGTKGLYKYNVNKNNLDKIIINILKKKINYRKNSLVNKEFYSHKINTNILRNKLFSILGFKNKLLIKKLCSLNLNRILPAHTINIDRKYIGVKNHDDFKKIYLAYQFFISLGCKKKYFALLNFLFKDFHNKVCFYIKNFLKWPFYFFNIK